MSNSDPEEIFFQLYKDVDGYEISRKGRKHLDYYYAGHTYGEVTFEGFSKMLKATHPQRGEVFYDLGSGTGKGVFLAALLYDFSKAVGIEIIKSLNEASLEVVQNFRRSYPDIEKNIEFIFGDFGEIDFSDGDVIYMNSTCFDYEVTLPFLRKLEKLKKGTRIITNTITLKSSSFKVENIGAFPFSWGTEDVFLHTKI